MCGAAGPDTPVHFIIAGAPRCDFVPSSNHSNLLSQQSLGFDRLRELEHSLQDRRMLAEPFVYRAMGSTAPSAAASIKCGSNNPHMQVVFSIRSRAELAESVQVTRACMLLVSFYPPLAFSAEASDGCTTPVGFTTCCMHEQQPQMNWSSSGGLLVTGAGYCLL